MADATDDEIEAGLFAVLEQLRVTAATPGPFVLVERYAGEVTRDGGVDDVTLGKSPSALLAFEGAAPEGEDGAYEETLGRDVEVVEKFVYRIYLTVKDERSITKGLKGATGQPGVLRCARLVKMALAGLDLPGLHGGDVVRLVDHRPWSIVRGRHYTHLVRVSARAGLPPSDLPAPGTPLTGLALHVDDSEPDEEGDRQPLAVGTVVTDV